MPVLKKIFLILPFLLLIPFISSNPSQQALAVYMTLWMVSWWIFEIVPMGITALLPMLFLPLSGLDQLKSLGVFYSHPIIYLFLGGFILALGLEKSGLSERFALNILKRTGKKAQGIVLGFIIATGFLSMWISNTATTVMMLPIAHSILQFIDHHTQSSKMELRKFSTATLLAIAYAANIGGTLTPIGTPPNVVLLGFLQDLYKVDVDFMLWILALAPVGIALFALLYYLLTKHLYRFHLELSEDFGQFIQNKLNILGPMDAKQKLTLAIFTVTCFLWIFKSVLNNLLGAPILHDTLIAIGAGIALFCIPFDFKNFKQVLKTEDISKLPWNIVLLFGGGMAMANTLKSVGLIDDLGSVFHHLGHLSVYTLVFLSASVVLVMTEFMSNVALTTVALPIFLTLAESKGFSLLQVGIPIALCSSFAFSMPISTPPNAIVFSTGELTVKQMLRAGILMNIISILVTMSIGWLMIQMIF